MSSPLLAAGWAEFLRLLPFVIAFLVWIIGRVATQLPQKPPPRGAVPPKPLPPPQAGQKVGDSLQGEINEFIRQAQAAREGRGAKPGQVPAAQSKGSIASFSDRLSDSRQKRVFRRPGQSDRDSRSQEKRPTAPPPVIAKASPRLEPAPPRESLAQHVAETLDSSKFARRATQLSQVQESTDSDFRRHMDRVFQHDLGNLKKETGGIFEAAGAAANAASDAAAAKMTAAAAGAQAGTAPVATAKRTSDIALFLAGRKNIRDAVILSEILQRPEHRW
jgi:hypothetical protein